MKRFLRIAAGALSVLCLLLLAAAPIGNASRGAVHPKAQAGAITIQSWLHATPSSTGLSGTVKACFKLSGAFTDQGGGPTWTDATYENINTAATKCTDEAPVGGFVFVPPVNSSMPSTVYAVHTVTGQKGQFFITFSGTYDLAGINRQPATYQGSGTWVITGGTGAYNGVQGEGTWAADARAFASGSPYIRHTETGQMWRISTS